MPSCCHAAVTLHYAINISCRHFTTAIFTPFISLIIIRIDIRRQSSPSFHLPWWSLNVMPRYAIVDSEHAPLFLRRCPLTLFRRYCRCSSLPCFHYTRLLIFFISCCFHYAFIFMPLFRCRCRPLLLFMLSFAISCWYAIIIFRHYIYTMLCRRFSALLIILPPITISPMLLRNIIFFTCCYHFDAARCGASRHDASENMLRQRHDIRRAVVYCRALLHVSYALHTRCHVPDAYIFAAEMPPPPLRFDIRRFHRCWWRAADTRYVAASILLLLPSGWWCCYGDADKLRCWHPLRADAMPLPRLRQHYATLAILMLIIRHYYFLPRGWGQVTTLSMSDDAPPPMPADIPLWCLRVRCFRLLLRRHFAAVYARFATCRMPWQMPCRAAYSCCHAGFRDITRRSPRCRCFYAFMRHAAMHAIFMLLIRHAEPPHYAMPPLMPMMPPYYADTPLIITLRLPPSPYARHLRAMLLMMRCHIVADAAMLLFIFHYGRLYAIADYLLLIISHADAAATPPPRRCCHATLMPTPTLIIASSCRHYCRYVYAFVECRCLFFAAPPIRFLCLRCCLSWRRCRHYADYADAFIYYDAMPLIRRCHLSLRHYFAAFSYYRYAIAAYHALICLRWCHFTRARYADYLRHVDYMPTRHYAAYADTMPPLDITITRDVSAALRQLLRLLFCRQSSSSHADAYFRCYTMPDAFHASYDDAELMLMPWWRRYAALPPDKRYYAADAAAASLRLCCRCFRRQLRWLLMRQPPGDAALMLYFAGDSALRRARYATFWKRHAAAALMALHATGLRRFHMTFHAHDAAAMLMPPMLLTPPPLLIRHDTRLRFERHDAADADAADAVRLLIQCLRFHYYFDVYFSLAAAMFRHLRRYAFIEA